MKKLTFIFVLTFLGGLLYNCQKGDNGSNFTNLNQIDSLRTLNEPTLIGDEIFLPQGTKWHFTNNSHSEVAFNLPDGFAFLLYDELSDKIKIAPSGGGYSCTCSEGGSCTVFWNKDLGYGCLHSSCTGSCTGERTKKQSNFIIEGVLYTKNNIIDINKPKFTASLSKKGKELFFNAKKVKNEIKRTYDFVYKNVKKPNFSDNNILSKINDIDHTLIKTYLYGFEIALLVPNDKNLDKLMPNVKKIAPSEAPTSCGCSSGESSGECKLKSKRIFGYKAYYCNGCTTCTMQ